MDDFFNSEIDLTGSVYTRQDLLNARRIYSLLFGKYYPTWPTNPKGMLAPLWNAPFSNAAHELIYVAILLDGLLAQTIEKCETILASKFVFILNCNDRDQYDETIAELRIGSFLGFYAAPIILEPLNFDENLNRRTTLVKSPDYLVSIASQDVFVEVTKWRIQSISDWGKQLEIIRERVKNTCNCRGINAQMEIRCQIGFHSHDLTAKVFDKLFSEMKSKPSGFLSLTVNSKIIQFDWQKIQIFNSIHDVWGSDIGFATAMTSGQGVEVSNLHATSIIPILDEQLEVMAVRSLKNVIKGKKKQFTAKGYTILCIEVEPMFSASYLHDILNRNIWISRDYRWINAIVITHKRVDFSAGSNDKIFTSFNSASQIKLPEDVLDVFSLKKRFYRGKVVQ